MPFCKGICGESGIFSPKVSVTCDLFAFNQILRYTPRSLVLLLGRAPHRRLGRPAPGPVGPCWSGE